MKPIALDIPSRAGITFLVDPDVPDLFKGRVPYLGEQGYVMYSNKSGGPQFLHRLLCKTLPGQHVDHINGDKLDNRRSNLRAVSPQVNQANRQKLNINNTSGHRGVCRRRGAKSKPWYAQISVSGQTFFLGSFATPGEAVAARIEAEKRHFGEECHR